MDTVKVKENLQKLHDLFKSREARCADAGARLQSPAIADKAEMWGHAASLLNVYCAEAGIMLQTETTLNRVPLNTAKVDTEVTIIGAATDGWKTPHPGHYA